MELDVADDVIVVLVPISQYATRFYTHTRHARHLHCQRDVRVTQSCDMLRAARFTGDTHVADGLCDTIVGDGCEPRISGSRAIASRICTREHACGTNETRSRSKEKLVESRVVRGRGPTWPGTMDAEEMQLTWRYMKRPRTRWTRGIVKISKHPHGRRA